MITPTVGRVVWFHPDHAHDQPQAAIITYVHSERIVNLAAFGPDGNTSPRASVRLLQDGEVNDEGEMYAVWMPYQVGQAAKTEELEKKLSEKKGFFGSLSR